MESPDIFESAVEELCLMCLMPAEDCMCESPCVSVVLPMEKRFLSREGLGAVRS